MIAERIPQGLVPGSSSLTFSADTIPEALLQEHTLAEGHWGVLHIFDGSLVFVDTNSGDERIVSAPEHIIIRPVAPHRVTLDGQVNYRIGFFREDNAASPMRTPGEFTDEGVRSSFERCEASGRFSEIFHLHFLNSSPEITPYFSDTVFRIQQKVLLDSVRMMVSHDVAVPEIREMLERLARTHSRDCRNVLPRLYELWLDSICRTVAELDPEWSDDLEWQWRVRLRTGMQILMAGY